MDLTARIVTLRLAETFVIARESADEAEVVQVEPFEQRPELRRHGLEPRTDCLWRLVCRLRVARSAGAGRARAQSSP